MLAHRKLSCISEMLREDMKESEILQRAGCLLYLEILKPLEALAEPHAIDDPTVLESRKGLLAFHEHGRGLEVDSPLSSPTQKHAMEPLHVPHRSPISDEEMQANQKHFGDEGTLPQENIHADHHSMKASNFHAKNVARSKAMLREIQRDNVSTLIDSGGLLALLASVQGYARPGCHVDAKGQVPWNSICLFSCSDWYFHNVLRLPHAPFETKH